METESEGIKTYQGDGEGKATCCSIMGGTEGEGGGRVRFRFQDGRPEGLKGGEVGVGNPNKHGVIHIGRKLKQRFLPLGATVAVIWRFPCDTLLNKWCTGNLVVCGRGRGIRTVWTQ